MTNSNPIQIIKCIFDMTLSQRVNVIGSVIILSQSVWQIALQITHFFLCKLSGGIGSYFVIYASSQCTKL